MARDFVVSGGGESLHTIIMGHEMYDELKNGTRIADDFLHSCSNVRSLSVVEKFGFWTSAFASQVEKLEVVDENSKLAIPKYCPSLINLNFHYTGCDGPWNHNSINWDNVGMKLESCYF